MTTILVVPCHNEERRLDGAAFQRFAEAHPDVRLLMVNDGSRDGTSALLRQLASRNPDQFAVLDLAHNVGKAEAIRRGVLRAAECRPDYIGYWDADLATPLDAVAHFEAVLDRHGEILLVVGSRLPLLGRDIRRRPLRRLLGGVFARCASQVLALRIRDTQCGAKLFRATPAMLALFSEPFASRWIFDVELLARLLKSSTAYRLPPAACRPIYELPLDRWEDVAGSKLKRGDFLKAICELAVIWWRYRRPWTPQSADHDELRVPQPRRAA